MEYLFKTSNMRSCSSLWSLFALSLFLTLGSITIVEAQETPFMEGEFIVMLQRGETPASILSAFDLIDGNNTGIAHIRELSELSNIHLFSIDVNAVDQYKILSNIQDHPAVRAAQFNHIVSDRATVPNDTQFASQWHHVDASDNDIDSDLAWDLTTGGTTANGDEIVVCVIEGGGADYDHSDLLANHWVNNDEIDGNGIDDDSNGFIDDYHGWNAPSGNDNIPAGNHGTAVSGMIGAKGNNSNGGAGVNWDVKIMQVVVGSLTEANVIAAYNYPYVLRNDYNVSGGTSGAFVVATNASWGIDNANPALYPVWCAYYNDLGSVGLLNCGATANNNVNVDVVGDMPTGCSSNYMIGVTATNSSDVRTFSGYGATSIDLGAPGENVWLPTTGSGYAFTSGTSFASPCTAGAIALMYSASCTDIATLAINSPQLAADQIRGYLLNGVDVVANLIGEVATGGRLNVRNSIDLLIAGCASSNGCTDPLACNYDSAALTDDGSCVYGTFAWYLPIDYSSAGEPAVYACSAPAGYYLANNQDCVQTVVDADSYCVTTDWDTLCQNAYCSCGGSGCIDPIACNYSSTAACDDGTCIDPLYYIPIAFDYGPLVYACSAPQGYILANQVCAQERVDNDPFCLVTNWDGICQAAYNCCVNSGATGCTSPFACNFCITSCTDDGSCLYPGCMDPIACNYSSTAGCDDGSCILPQWYLPIDFSNFNEPAIFACSLPVGYYLANDQACVQAIVDADSYCVTTDWDGACQNAYCLCSGGACTDSTACNYDALADCDDSSCTYPQWYLPYDVSASSTPMIWACEAPLGYYLADQVCAQEVADIDSYCYVTDWDGFCQSEYNCCNGATVGCIDPNACNYDANACYDFSLCVYPGCTYAGADNYDSTAGCDDGSCTFPDPSACPSDVNGDCLTNTSDLLFILGQFGTICSSCP